MIENIIFNKVLRSNLTPAGMSEQEYIRTVKELADDDIDGSNINRACIFATQLYRYNSEGGASDTPLKPKDFGSVLGVRV